MTEANRQSNVTLLSIQHSRATEPKTYAHTIVRLRVYFIGNVYIYMYTPYIDAIKTCVDESTLHIITNERSEQSSY